MNLFWTCPSYATGIFVVWVVLMIAAYIEDIFKPAGDMEIPSAIAYVVGLLGFGLMITVVFIWPLISAFSVLSPDERCSRSGFPNATMWEKLNPCVLQ